MPCDYSLYPSDWKERRARILKRADNRCEECGVANRSIGYRTENDNWRQLADCRANAGQDVENLSMEGVKIVEIVLTIAHLDRTGAPGPADGPLDCPDDRLKALCQRCHLRLDAKRHAAKAAKTRLNRRAVGSLLEYTNVNL